MTARVWPISHVRSSRLFGASGLISAALLVSSQLALAQFTQQGAKLVGTGAVGPNVQQGNSVALSADGNTAIVGGPGDTSASNFFGVGTAWVFTRSNGTWTQQGSKLVGTGAVGNSGQGTSVALSADGNTAIVGGAGDNASVGAAWIFTRSGGIWTQQGSKLVGAGAVGGAEQGWSVALSSDGNTAIVGGRFDNSATGAVWIYTRNGAVWAQQGSKLVGIGAVGNAQQGNAVALSADGNTAMAGGPLDTFGAGAAWVYIRSGGLWTQQGSKLIGTTSTEGIALQGTSVALSGDGGTAIVGGPFDNASIGAAWVYTRSGGVWTQQGSKLVGTGVGETAADQGQSVALSADGNTALVGGYFDSAKTGATWVYIRNGGVWTQKGSKLVGTGAVGNAEQGLSVALSGDGNTAIMGGPEDNSNAGAAWVFAQPPVPFSAFSAKLTIFAYKPSFALLSDFTLGSTSNGINPLFEDVTLRIGSFTTTIPPGSFTMTGPGDYSFVGVIDTVTLNVLIKLKAGKEYTFQAAANVNLAKTKSPVPVTLTIGNDTGTTTARF